MKLTNLKSHALIGFCAGILGAFIVLQAPWTNNADGLTSPAELRTTLFGALAWLLVTLLWEAIQYLLSKNKADYFPRKTADTLVDIFIGNLCFLLPWVVLTLGTYAGNILRT